MFRVLSVQGAGCSGCSAYSVCLGCWVFRVFSVFRVLVVQDCFVVLGVEGV